MSQSVASSVLQSSTKNWDLTQYELQRTPQEVITDDTEIAVSPRSLHNELMCPICLDMLRCTMTTKECLHRFCAECITTALRSGNKECPTCRKKLVSRRSLRPDPNFDALISKIYPSRDEYEAHQERMLQSLTKHHNGGALSASIEEGLKSQAMNRLQKPRKNENMLAAKAMEVLKRAAPKISASAVDNTRDPSAPPSSKKSHLPEMEVPPDMMQTSSTEPAEEQEMAKSSLPEMPQRSTQMPTTSAAVEQKQTENSMDTTTDSEDSIDMSSVEMIFKPHPDQTGSEVERSVRYIKTSVYATVSHMAEFIKIRISLEMKSQTTSDVNSVTQDPTKSEAEYQMFVAGPDNFKVLPPDMSLETVQGHCWKKDNPLEIFYLKKNTEK